LPVSEQELEHAGSEVVDVPLNQEFDDTGYMLFGHTGKYELRVEQGGHVVATAVIQID
jgi:hypothetical protein